MIKRNKPLVCFPVGKLKNDRYQFVSSDSDCTEISSMYNLAGEYGGFFVLLKDGEYRHIFGIIGNIPYMDKLAYKVI